MNRTIALTMLAPLLLSAQAEAATILAGWDAWDDPAAPTATVTAAGVSATASASAATGGWANTEGGGRGSSKDGSWGTFDGNGAAPSALTDGAGLNFTAISGVTDAQVSITLVNNGVETVFVDAIHFDAVAFRPNAPRSYAVEVLSGDLTVGNVFTSAAPEADNSSNAITHLGGALKTDDSDPETHDQHEDIDLSLAGLADNALAAGESVVIQLEFFNGTGSGGGHHLFLDNLAISGRRVPEPSTAGLLVLGMLAGRARRHASR